MSEQNEKKTVTRITAVLTEEQKQAFEHAAYGAGDRTNTAALNRAIVEFSEKYGRVADEYASIRNSVVSGN